jgi:hypothetical protein
MMCAIRHAIVVTGTGSGAGYCQSIVLSGRTVHASGTGSQKYSSSVMPSSRGRNCTFQWNSSWSVNCLFQSMSRR